MCLTTTCASYDMSSFDVKGEYICSAREPEASARFVSLCGVTDKMLVLNTTKRL